MDRKMINDEALEEVVGGSILFSPDHTTCGKNCTDQYKVLNYDACIDYIRKNCNDMREKTMLKNMVDKGYLKAM